MQTESLSVSGKEISSKTVIDTAKTIGPELSKYVAEDENLRRLSSPVVTTLRESGLYRLFLPKSLGGFEADPVTTARVVEEIASHNTAAGWSLMVANTSWWWTSRLSSHGVEALFDEGRDAFIAGAFHPPMKATPVDGGFRINGRSPLTSNVHEARWIFVTAFVMQGEQIKMNNGIPEIIGVMMKSEDCSIIDTWHTFGMRATDSNDVDDLYF
jgi:alkylation response protein AidB-like acyl-CoA dehydrogenase